MKKTLKILGVSLLMMMLMTISVFADDLRKIDEYMGSTNADVANSTVSILDEVLAYDESTYNEVVENFAANGYDSLADGISKIKDVVDGGESFVEYITYGLYENEDGNPVSYILTEFSENYYIFSVEYQVSDSGTSIMSMDLERVCNYQPGDEIPTEFDINDYQLTTDENNASTLQFVFDKETLAGAGVNTLIGLGVVFSVLIFISILIWAFKFITPEGRNYKPAPVVESTEKQTGSSNKADNELVAAITAAVITDETQLVAAITAAISAYEGVSADTFVVRTIKKRKW